MLILFLLRAAPYSSQDSPKATKKDPAISRQVFWGSHLADKSLHWPRLYNPQCSSLSGSLYIVYVATMMRMRMMRMRTWDGGCHQDATMRPPSSFDLLRFGLKIGSNSLSIRTCFFSFNSWVGEEMLEER